MTVGRPQIWLKCPKTIHIIVETTSFKANFCFHVFLKGKIGIEEESLNPFTTITFFENSEQVFFLE